MSYSFEQLHHDLRYFFHDDRDGIKTIHDFTPTKLQEYEIFTKKHIPEVKQWLIDNLNIDTKEYKVEFKPGAGNLSWAPWIGINKKHSNNNGPDSYYIALIYSAQNDALLLDITTSGNYMHNDLKLNYQEISGMNLLLQETICKRLNIIAENMNLVKKRVVPTMPLNATANLYLYTAVFYSYIPMDIQNKDDIEAYTKWLFKVWTESNSFVEPKQFFNENKESASEKHQLVLSKVDFTLDPEIHKNELKKEDKKTYVLDVLHGVPADKKLNNKNENSPKYNPTREAADQIREGNKDRGDLAEDLVVQFEKDRLINEGKPDLAEKVHKLKTDNDGYDVDSFNTDGTIKRIEVKSNSSGGDSIIISDNELKKVLSNYSEIYYVKNPASNNPKISKVELQDDPSILIPLNYRVNIK